VNDQVWHILARDIDVLLIQLSDFLTEGIEGTLRCTTRPEVGVKLTANAQVENYESLVRRYYNEAMKGTK